MTNCINKYLRNSLVLGLLFMPGMFMPGRLYAVEATGSDYDMTKCLIGSSGVNQATAGDYSAAYALGEDAAATESFGTDYDFVSGYFSGYASGRVGTFNLASATVGSGKILQDGFQVGVPLNATVQLAFSNNLDPTTIAGGIQVMLVMDHLGQSQDTLLPFIFTYDVTGTTVVISPQNVWPGNTLVDVMANSNLQSIDGFALAQVTHTQFITVLDPHQENVVLHPIPVSNGAQALGLANSPALSLDIPTDSLSDYFYVLVSQDPAHNPLQVDPKILQTATEKAQSNGGAYQTPLTLQEIAAYNQQGQPMSLAKSISFSINYTGGLGPVTGGGLPVRYETLSLWSLDSAHQLWVKMPDSHPNGPGVMGSVTQFSVYALMGSSEGNASSVFVFPMPWRPHGPGAGNGAGQTGTEAGGITFNNLPSESTIKIYTIAGELVRQLHHSDLVGPIGQEKWDGNTSGGDHAASGVYPWRVESSADSKNGQLMVIR